MHISLVLRLSLPPEYVRVTSNQKLGAGKAWEDLWHRHMVSLSHVVRAQCCFNVECVCHVW